MQELPVPAVQAILFYLYALKSIIKPINLKFTFLQVKVLLLRWLFACHSSPLLIRHIFLCVCFTGSFGNIS